ncbi:hypothetical protein L1049_019416 [Liquidambar formosana]|uniref:Protein prenyltransferase alpha subunit repeat-containing protein 1 n=1 Tax=Liquidambar formosana TaxID=63359 RepID=A0AAP0S5Q6_LIQFO
MSEESYSEEKALELLKQLENILECDTLIDEVGFIHPTQFVTLNEEESGSLVSSISGEPQSEVGILSSGASDVGAPKYEKMIFWNKDHKLGISTQSLLPLYKAAKHAFMSAIRQYEMLSNISVKNDIFMDEDVPCSLTSASSILEIEVMKHSKALLLLSCDFGTAWNSRKLVVSKKQHVSILMDELLLSALVLSYSPKSDHAWSHRRWVIKMIAGKCSNLQDIVGKESELVEKIAEKSRMNYRAWNHRCWLVSYMTGEQVLYELKKSRNWAGLHIADNCCFHYRRRLLLRILKDFCYTQDPNASFGCTIEVYQVWKEELDWNEMLIKRYIGREALWLHRRFLSLYWVKHFATNLHGVSCHSENKTGINHDLDIFMDNELQLLHSCSRIPDNIFEDVQAQAMFSATYILWLTKQISDSQWFELKEKLTAVDLKTLLNVACPEKNFLWDSLMGLHGSI